MTLRDISLKYSMPEHGETDMATIHSYPEYFEKLFAPYQHTAQRVLEVGVRNGGSLKTWHDWFSKATIYGIDNGLEAGIWTPPAEYAERIKVAYGDTFKPDTVIGTIEDVFNVDLYEFDVIIDDGCHNVLAQAATWGMLYPFLRKGGCYVITDIEGITHAIALQRHFGGEIEDRRVIQNRHDDICLAWIKE